MNGADALLHSFMMLGINKHNNNIFIFKKFDTKFVDLESLVYFHRVSWYASQSSYYMITLHRFVSVFVLLRQTWKTQTPKIKNKSSVAFATQIDINVPISGDSGDFICRKQKRNTTWMFQTWSHIIKSSYWILKP